MSDARRWKRTIRIGEESFEVEFCQRPFREGLEVVAVVDGEVVHFGELGLGENAVGERLQTEIAKVRASRAGERKPPRDS